MNVWRSFLGRSVCFLLQRNLTRFETPRFTTWKATDETIGTMPLLLMLFALVLSYETRGKLTINLTNMKPFKEHTNTSPTVAFSRARCHPQFDSNRFVSLSCCELYRSVLQMSRF